MKKLIEAKGYAPEKVEITQEASFLKEILEVGLVSN